MAKEITVQYLQALESELRELYKDQDDTVRHMREVRECTWSVPVPDEARLTTYEYHDPTISDECQRTAAMHSINPIEWQIRPAKDSEAALENSTLREHWTAEVFRIAGTRSPGRDTVLDVIDAAFNDGGAWAKLLFAKDVWDEVYRARLDKGDQVDEAGDEAAKKAAGPPFHWLPVDVLTVLPVPGSRLIELLEIQERPEFSALRQYGLSRNKRGDIVPEELGEGEPIGKGKARSKVLFYQHWTNTTCSYAVVGTNNKGEPTGQIVQSWEHGYGQVPYFFAPGIMMAHWRNRKVGWGVGESKRPLVEYKSFLRTINANIAARDVLGAFFREVPNDLPPLFGNDGKPVHNEAIEIGKIKTGRPGEKIGAFPFPQNNATLQAEIALTTQDIEKLSAPRMAGNISGLEGAGFAYSQVQADERARHDPTVQNIERMYEAATKFLWKLMRVRVAEPVWIYQEGKESGWLSAGPDDLTDTVGIKCHLNPERATAKIIEERYWHERLAAGTTHFDEAIEAMGDNPDEVRKGKTKDRIRGSQIYQRLEEWLIASKAGRGDLLGAAMSAQAEAMVSNGQGGQVPQGAPGMQDQANLTMAPNGQGAAPTSNMQGISPGAVVPGQSAAGGMQGLTP